MDSPSQLQERKQRLKDQKRKRRKWKKNIQKKKEQTKEERCCRHLIFYSSTKYRRLLAYKPPLPLVGLQQKSSWRFLSSLPPCRHFFMFSLILSSSLGYKKYSKRGNSWRLCEFGVKSGFHVERERERTHLLCTCRQHAWGEGMAGT